MEKQKNKIPRNFSRIVGEILTETNFTRPGETLHIYKSHYRFLTLNTATGKYFYSPVVLLRDSRFFKINTIIY